MFIRCIAVAAVLITATSFPAAAAVDDESSEPRACAALARRDRKMVERLPRDFIEKVDRLTAVPLPPSPILMEPMNEPEEPVFLGAVITVRPVEGLTVERLQRLVWCGLARTSAAEPARRTDWPRMPPGTRGEVYSGGDKFIVILRPPDAAASEALWRAVQEMPLAGGPRVQPAKGKRRWNVSAMRGQ